MKTNLLLLFGILASGLLSAKQSPNQFVTKIHHKISLGYQLYLPDEYDAEKDKEWPVILFLHGAGERGITSNW